MSSVGVTVVVPAYGSAGSLVTLLAELSAQARTARRILPVVVSDDASPEPLEPLLAAQELPGLALSVVRSPSNGGPGAARNRAVARVGTPWVAFVDADEVPGPAWLACLLELLDAGDGFDVVEGRVEGTAQRATPFTHAGEFASEAEQAMGLGGNNAVRVELLRRLGGFDEDFFDRRRRVHFREDTDLCFRLLDAGARLRHEPRLVVRHPPAAPSFWTPVREARRYYFDPLLHRRHPERFTELVGRRRVGPLSLRGARHHAASLLGAGLVVTCLGWAARRRSLSAAGATVLAAGWAANAAAICWHRQVRVSDVPAVLAAAALTPLSYLWAYWRGVMRYRHRARF